MMTQKPNPVAARKRWRPLRVEPLETRNLMAAVPWESDDAVHLAVLAANPGTGSSAIHGEQTQRWRSDDTAEPLANGTATTALHAVVVAAPYAPSPFRSGPMEIAPLAARPLLAPITVDRISDRSVWGFELDRRLPLSPTTVGRDRVIPGGQSEPSRSSVWYLIPAAWLLDTSMVGLAPVVSAITRNPNYELSTLAFHRWRFAVGRSDRLGTDTSPITVHDLGEARAFEHPGPIHDRLVRAAELRRADFRRESRGSGEYRVGTVGSRLPPRFVRFNRGSIHGCGHAGPTVGGLFRPCPDAHGGPDDDRGWMGRCRTGRHGLAFRGRDRFGLCAAPQGGGELHQFGNRSGAQQRVQDCNNRTR